MIGFPSVVIEDPALGNPTRIRSLRAFDDLASSVPSIRHLRDSVDAELSAHKARWAEADERIGYSRARHEEELAMNREQELADLLWSMPASSLAGIAAKLAALIHSGEPSEDCDEFPWPQIRSALADLLRLSQAGSFIEVRNEGQGR
ncbi:hypothetical protein ACMDCR_10280 [Labrys okinawensis]|uniref:hypothetical protein n=1 Tax=Labrys okinawensis TaxID=346911 RepID=UPI0039BC4257